MINTFRITTLGCRVNQYESEQIATLLRARGLVDAPDGGDADLSIINTCSVTSEAASKSRQMVRRGVRLPVLAGAHSPWNASAEASGKVIVTGCWATSHPEEARRLPGVSAVVGHHGDVAAELGALLDQWLDAAPAADTASSARAGTTRLPLLTDRQPDRQRALLKIQDGCDAHCTYCIIPRLRPRLWSKPVDDAVAEARQLVDAGHREIVLTGIFLSAFGQSTALHRRQPSAARSPLGALIEALCTRIPRLARLRLSSLEPGDLRGDLLQVLASYPQVMPHFHLPLQSGSDRILRRMNRQYTRDDYLHMVDQVRSAFDRPAITTDIIVGFPGETDDAFLGTLDVADRVGFIHTHAFPFSARPGTAAARWTGSSIPGNLVNQRIDILRRRAVDASAAYRREFLDQSVTVMIERRTARQVRTAPRLWQGRSERYFSVWLESDDLQPGDAARVRIDRIASQRTLGTLIERILP